MRDLNALDLIHGRKVEPESDQQLIPAEKQHESLISHGAFDPMSHKVDVRRIDSQQTPGRYNLPDIGLFVFRLRSYPVCMSQALEQRFGSHCFTFSPLGNDQPLFIKAVPESGPNNIADEINLPVPLRRRAFTDRDSADPKHASEEYYGVGKSLVIWTRGWKDQNDGEPLPAQKVIPADLSDWEAYLPPTGFVAVDPVLGRMVFPPKQFPTQRCLRFVPLWVERRYWGRYV